ncbi:SUMF1/EgtB/PvdO family nonheme iron enzyme [Ramlibacter sp.]|uniref:SUMF1/EgtB/PvdO family nonheme iron enzyme n=1 Tax=Ramlibacter sp. TaxID=1917967 RepID=UPI002BE22398|nr:SUMF1/EgtB/PvdO family nonheme iron enzyme [Ramlibacter sp.]HWI82725.1 SUMF1/EgtB/PvdO family nonheme iron enzyme [Ramlibacter sp.]
MPAVFPDATPASIDAPSMRHAGRELLSLALMDARNHTLHLLSHFERLAAARPPVPPPRPGAESPFWLAGHVGWLAEYWIGRNPQRSLGPACPAEPVRLASVDPMADQWFNPALVAAPERWQLRLPGAAAIRAYLLQTLESTLELLEKTAEDDAALHFFRMALFHEDLRCEQLVALAQALGVALQLALPAGGAARDPVLVPAGRWTMGSGPGGFAFDLERPAHEVEVPEFEIDAQPVRWSQYVEFVEDGGYDRAELWQPGGWEWLAREGAREGRRGPRYVEQIGVAGGAVLQTHFGRATRLGGNQSVMHVSWWEADAWARWAGRRLPTEVEWELAAHAAGRRGFRWGDVREWTASTLRPWPGYAPDVWNRGTDLEPLPAFGLARVQRGASFAARARMKHPKLRSFALPERDDGFVGFRTCAW